LVYTPVDERIGTPVTQEQAGPARGTIVRRPRRRRAGPRQVSWLIAVPSVALLLAYHFVAPISSVGYAFTDWNGLTSPRWIGLRNFREILHSGVSNGALKNTLFLAATLLVVSNAFGCLLALALNRTLKTRNFLRAIFFLPFVIAPLATSYVWQYIFSYEGTLNQFLGAVGLESWKTAWLGDPTWALWTVAAALVWQTAGLCMVIYLAGLQGIPPEIEEAAVVDGAKDVYRLRRVILPLLAPSITIASTLMLIYGMRVFDQVLAITGGGPVGTSETLATQVYEQTFTYGRFGFGAALSVVLSLMIMLLALGQLLILRSREDRTS
jgi:raffinose/stachyose/melibiose transport system permease protein